MTTPAPFGSWRSPITAELLVEDAIRLGSVEVDGDDLYWSESRPAEGGRQVIVRRRPDGSMTDVLGEGFGARTLVHEYGGRASAIAGGVVYFSNFSDQRLYRMAADGGEARALTPAPRTPRSVRFADPVVSPDGGWIVCVRERHLDPSGAEMGEVVNDVVAIPLTGGEPVVVAEGHDFFAAPRLSPDGARLCWLWWDHPNMPWDGTHLEVAPFADGRLGGRVKSVAGGPAESVSQPRWSPDGRLHYVSDRTGWWNLYDDEGRALCPREAEFSGPDWVFGQSTYGFLEDATIVAAVAERNLWHLCLVRKGQLSTVDGPWTMVSSLQVLRGGSEVVAIVASPAEAPAVVRIGIGDGRYSVLRRSSEAEVDRALISVPEPIEFPTEGGTTAHAFFYPARNPEFSGPGTERPPLIVMIHGGPTSASGAVLDLGLQYWTSRGFAVVDVNYGGSTGYGRDYRNRLQGSWGVVDVDDCVNAARWLADQGRVDGDRMVITGGSAGGYTTLAALAFRDLFAAGASHYGVADVESLALHTHKFESRYLDGLIGPYPQARDVYLERSPIRSVSSLDVPMILFQGLDDKVVPPEQAEMMAEALRRNGVPFAYVAFEGEPHGFRKAETIRRVAEAELWFYGRVLGFAPGDEIEPVRIENDAAVESSRLNRRRHRSWGRRDSNPRRRT